MKILTRYVLREFLVPLGYCLAGFLSIYVLFDLFASLGRMLEAKLSFVLMVQYFAGYLAPYFHYIAPAALMLATLYTMWTFCRHSELIAMRASGISFMSIVKPLLSVALLMGGFVYWVNECYVPQRAHWAAQMKTVKFETARIARADNIMYCNRAGHRTWNIDSMSDDSGCHLQNVRISIDRPGGARLKTIIAQRADYLEGEWWLTDAKVQHYNVQGVEIATPTPELDALTFRCFDELDEVPGDLILQNRPPQFFSMRDRQRYLTTHPELSSAARRDLVFDNWAQIMSPWACVIITLFAIPAGIASGRQSVFRGIIGALTLYFSFYALTIGGMVVAKNGWLNPIVAAVAPGLIFLSLGIRAFFKQR